MRIKITHGLQYANFYTLLTCPLIFNHASCAQMKPFIMILQFVLVFILLRQSNSVKTHKIMCFSWTIRTRCQYRVSTDLDMDRHRSDDMSKTVFESDQRCPAV